MADQGFEQEILAEEEALTTAALEGRVVPVTGEPLPEGFVNPPIGEVGHFCVDGQGRYQPDYVQLYLYKQPGQQDPLPIFLGTGGSDVMKTHRWRLRAGYWVDCHPGVKIVLDDAVAEHHIMDIDAAMAAGGVSENVGENTPHVTHLMPNYMYRWLPSAR